MRESQSLRALLKLRTLVLGGEFEAGSRLPETELATILGISRTPLRQAVDALVSEGLLVRLPSGRCQVASFTPEDVIDAIELRGLLEGMAARLAAERGVAKEQMEKMNGILDFVDTAFGDSQDDASDFDFDVYAEGNQEFHEQLAILPGSEIVERELERARARPLASPSTFIKGSQHSSQFPVSALLGQQQHRSILEAIAHREGARAEALAREHARLARENLDNLLQMEPGLAATIPGLSLVSNN